MAFLSRRLDLKVHGFSHESVQLDVKFNPMWELDLNITIQEDIWKQALNGFISTNKC